MTIKLCYKEYDFKMSLGSMRKFKDQTGLDLWHTLVQFIDAYASTEGFETIPRMNKLYSICDFYTAAKAFHCLIQENDKSIPLEEIEDAMFRVGWLPSNRDDLKSEPWPLVMVSLAFSVSMQFQEASKAKKTVTSGEVENK